MDQIELFGRPPVPEAPTTPTPTPTVAPTNRMRLAAVRIQNFRGFYDETVPLNEYTCLVGPNGAGKSTVLAALCIFFRTPGGSVSVTALDEEDFHARDTSRPVSITLTFEALSDEAKRDFGGYVRQDKLIVSAVASFDQDTGSAPIKQFGMRLGMKAFAPFFDAFGDGKPVGELTDLYKRVVADLPDLPNVATKPKMHDALRKFEAEHPDDCELLSSADEFYGVSKGTNRLNKYIQWVYVPAVKDASTEEIEAKNTALGQLLARTVRAKTTFGEGLSQLKQQAHTKYEELLQQNQPALNALSASLASRLQEWSHPGTRLRLEWQGDPEKAVRVDEPLAAIIAGEGAFEGRLARFGHGLQRSYLLALLQELAGVDTGQGPCLLLACEEPELYQHPPQAKHLASVLQALSTKNAQILVSTHSPHFVSGKGFEDIRLVRKDATTFRSRVAHTSATMLAEHLASAGGYPTRSASGTIAKLHQELQPSLNEMFFASTIILVEGVEDLAYITTYFHLLGLQEEFRRRGCHVVPVNGKSHMIQPRAVAELLQIPVFMVFDGDGNDKKNAEKHFKDNKALLGLAGLAIPDGDVSQTYWGTNVVVWKSEIGDVVREDIGLDKWNAVREPVLARYGHMGGMEKNVLAIGETLAEAWERGLRSPSLDRLCQGILKFAKRPLGEKTPPAAV